jgi:RNA polymerase sigma-70 factor (ECF subfamily)
MPMIDRDRVAQLVVERAPQLVLFARQWLDDASAHDAVQDALTALLMQKLSPADPIAWMYRTVRNQAIDRARSIWRRRRREQTVASQRVECFESRTESIIDAQTAQQMLAVLDDDRREIVVLRIWGELGFAQIAEVVGLSLSSVHERYTSALAQMRSQLEQPCKKT